jgi:hypothetical protein
MQKRAALREVEIDERSEKQRHKETFMVALAELSSLL